MAIKKNKLSIIFCILLAIVLALGIMWKSITYDNLQDAAQSVNSVTVQSNNNTIFFDGPGTNEAFIFYPGAFVEASSYSDLLSRISAGGIDCFVIDMPLRFAMLSISAADNIIKNYPEYTVWYIGGHSLGGVAACTYAEKHSDGLNGIILLASYSSVDLSGSGLSVLSVTGSNDGVINRDRQESSRLLLPDSAHTVTIDGGNHAQFGTYGFQKGDLTAEISGAEQRELTSAAIIEFAHTTP